MLRDIKNPGNPGWHNDLPPKEEYCWSKREEIGLCGHGYTHVRHDANPRVQRAASWLISGLDITHVVLSGFEIIDSTQAAI